VSINPCETAKRISGAVNRTPLLPWGVPDNRIELRLKLECLQETGSFKARGAVNQISLMSEGEREAGVVACSSGNHGRALAWASRKAGVDASIFLPADAYPNKIDAIRAEGAKAVVCPTRQLAEEACSEAVSRGATLVHPYDSWRTIEGASTVGVEIGEDWPEVDCVVVPVGGGGLASGVLLGLEAACGRPVPIVGVEPRGARGMAMSINAGEPIVLGEINTDVQGLCPLVGGKRNWEILSTGEVYMESLTDDPIFETQRDLQSKADWPVEPAGAAAVAWVLSGGPSKLNLFPSSEEGVLRVAAIVSGGNSEQPQKGV